MSSKRRLRRKQCEGKTKYDTFDAALTTVKWIKRRKIVKDKCPYNIYKCPFCGKFHFGHAIRSTVRGRNDYEC